MGGSNSDPQAMMSAVMKSIGQYPSHVMIRKSKWRNQNKNPTPISKRRLFTQKLKDSSRIDPQATILSEKKSVVMVGILEEKYSKVRLKLDELGYKESFPINALGLVEHLLTDIISKNEALDRITAQSNRMAKSLEEFQNGVEPFKTETVRLTKENSILRLETLKAQQNAEQVISANRSHLIDLECENSELKLLVDQFIKRIKDLESESFQNKVLGAGISLEQAFDIAATSDGANRHCSAAGDIMQVNCSAAAASSTASYVRIRNSVGFGRNRVKEPKAVEYMKIADSRIECLQLLVRQCKKEKEELQETIARLQGRMAEGDTGSVKGIEMGQVKSSPNLQMALKTAHLQLNILQRRNIELEEKLKSFLLNDHQKLIRGRKLTKELENEMLEGLIKANGGNYPSLDEMSLEQKNKLLEAQLSHCCEEKAKLKFLLEQCEEKERSQVSSGGRSSSRPSKAPHSSPEIENSRFKKVSSRAGVTGVPKFGPRLKQKANQHSRKASKETEKTELLFKRNEDMGHGSGESVLSEQENDGDVIYKPYANSNQKESENIRYTKSMLEELEDRPLTSPKSSQVAIESQKRLERTLPTASKSSSQLQIVQMDSRLRTELDKRETKRTLSKKTESTKNNGLESKVSKEIIMSPAKSGNQRRSQSQRPAVSRVQQAEKKQTSTMKRGKIVGDSRTAESNSHEERYESDTNDDSEVEDVIHVSPVPISKKPKTGKGNNTSESRQETENETVRRMTQKEERSTSKPKVSKHIGGVAHSGGKSRNQEMSHSKLTGETEKEKPETKRRSNEKNDPRDVDSEKSDGNFEDRGRISTSGSGYVDPAMRENSAGSSGFHVPVPGYENSNSAPTSIKQRSAGRKQVDAVSTGSPRLIQNTHPTSQSNVEDMLSASDQRPNSRERELEEQIQTLNQTKENLARELNRKTKELISLQESLDDQMTTISHLSIDLKKSERKIQSNENLQKTQEEELAATRSQLDNVLRESETLRKEREELLQLEDRRNNESSAPANTGKAPSVSPTSREQSTTETDHAQRFPKGGQGQTDAGSSINQTGNDVEDIVFVFKPPNLNQKDPQDEFGETKVKQKEFESTSLKRAQKPTREKLQNANPPANANSSIPQVTLSRIQSREDALSLVPPTSRSLSQSQSLTSANAPIETSYEDQLTPNWKERQLEREILSLKTNLNSSETSKEELRRELERKSQELNTLRNELELQANHISQLTVSLKKSEMEIRSNEKIQNSQERELELQRRQLENIRKEMEELRRDREELLKRYRNANSAQSLSELDRRNLGTELEKKNQQVEELRGQIQRFVEEVRRVEEILQEKEEENEHLLNQYRALRDEFSELENAQLTLERESDSVRQTTRQAVEQNSSLKTQLTRQSSLVKSYEDEIERLSKQVASLETQLNGITSSGKSLEKDSKLLHEQYLGVEKKLDSTSLALKDCESHRRVLEAENRDLLSRIENLEKVNKLEGERMDQLRQVADTYRETKAYQDEKLRALMEENASLEEKNIKLAERNEKLHDELSHYRIKCTEALSEVERIQREFQSEKTERASALQELKNLRDQLSSSTTSRLLRSALYSHGSNSISPTTSGSTGMSQGSDQARPNETQQEDSANFTP